MKKKFQFLILDVIGILFLVWGIIAISLSMYNQTPAQILFMCYLGIILIGIGILTKRSFIIMSQIYILAIPILVWNIDFLHWLIFNQPLFGITNYFFTGSHSLIGKIISLQHLFTVPLAIYAASIIGVKRRDAWKWSFVQITIIYLLVSWFSSPDLNINCIFSPCINIYFGLPYGLTWFIIIFGMTFITSILLNTLPLIKLKDDKKIKR